MALSPGTRVGPYEIAAKLGEGGMGEVYRARDSRLKRDVALKALPHTFASDPERLARFQREAEVLASLNHPNIAQIYGIEDETLVMELVEGETLADRIARGRLPVDDALAIAAQIIDALKTAHDQGVVHRDLKPANIKVRPDGTVKVLDFGLAKLTDPTGVSGSAPGMSMSPTITSPAMMTGVGMILGTAAYMAPEQAKGRPVDRRCDVWAFGCVLYEMLAGRRAFEGDDVTETLATILKGEPDWSAIDSLPATVRTAVHRCLEKDPRRRIQDIGDVRLVLDGAFTSSEPTGVATRRRSLLPLVATGVLAVAVGAGAAWLSRAPAPTPDAPVKRFTIALPEQELFPVGGGDLVSISPDGQTIAYVSRNASNRTDRLYRRRLDEPDAMPIGEPGAREPAISPDGRWIAYCVENVLLKVSTGAGPSQTLARLPSTSRGIAWLGDDTLIVGSNLTTVGLVQVPAAGGTPVPLTTPAAGRLDREPHVLSDRHTLIYTSSAPGTDEGELRLLDLRTHQTRTLLPGIDGQVLRNGSLALVRDNVLWTVPFDEQRLQVSGTPTAAVQGVRVEAGGAVQLAVGADGTLVYIEGRALQTSHLVFFDRAAQAHPLPLPPRAYADVRLSPTGDRAALGIRDQERDIWIWDFARQGLTRFTFDPAADFSPIWTPDGRRIIFSSRRNGPANPYWQAADGTGQAERLVEDPRDTVEFSVAPDGKRLVMRVVDDRNGNDIALLNLDDNPRRLQPLISTRFNERDPEISPDGKWIAYDSDESGRPEVYVRPFPMVDGGRWQVSTNGGRIPRWSSGGHELMFVGNTGGWWTAAVLPGNTFSSTTPQQLLGAALTVSNVGMDAALDGQRFIAIQRDDQPFSNRINVVLNWFTALKPATH